MKPPVQATDTFEAERELAGAPPGHKEFLVTIRMRVWATGARDILPILHGLLGDDVFSGLDEVKTAETFRSQRHNLARIVTALAAEKAAKKSEASEGADPQ